ncbi:MAG: hypothetical protein ACR2MF_10430 [Chthoniobacterales bacterium]
MAVLPQKMPNELKPRNVYKVAVAYGVVGRNTFVRQRNSVTLDGLRPYP